MNFVINVVNKIATAVDAPVIICGNSNYVVDFTFDSEWDRYVEKTARFKFKKDGKKAYIDILFSGTQCNVPILTDIDMVEIGVYAGNLSTTTGARVDCEKSILCGDATQGKQGFGQQLVQIEDFIGVFANALKGSKSGSAIVIDDVSPVEHELGVSVYGKNLAVDLKDREIVAIDIEPQAEKPITGTKLFKGMSSNGYLRPNRTTSFNNENGVITFVSDTSYGLGIDVEVQGGKTYTVSADIVSNSGTMWRVSFYKDGILHSYISNQATFTVPEECNQIIAIICPKNNVEEICVSNFQLEEGTTATAYEPYIDLSTVKVSSYGKNFFGTTYNGQTVTANADGTVNGLMSISPNMTILTDTDGVIITIDYNRDINKAFAKLEQALLNI